MYRVENRGNQASFLCNCSTKIPSCREGKTNFLTIRKGAMEQQGKVIRAQ